MSSGKALWISQQERVELLTVIGSPNTKYAEPKFRVQRSDGTVVTVERSDILLAEEEQLIEELADILRRSSNPARHDRYSFIMMSLMRKAVPFKKKLEARLPAKHIQQTLPLSDVG